ncbi:hypothetical protein GCM10012287_08980 [Streptomyces daqingensis]|uniref:Uncharacterized protein n=1 Tax=Streptomyces daqingensis TaxID=1472640 RepID=A0ABQ2LX13_9ACTN|nr:hypothetical protein GCM10012287_08980 [Streptomyces daqingensis]
MAETPEACPDGVGEFGFGGVEVRPAESHMRIVAWKHDTFCPGSATRPTGPPTAAAGRGRSPEESRREIRVRYGPGTAGIRA